MAIRDKFRRAMGSSRKSVSSSTSSSQSHHDTSTLASTEPEPAALTTTTTTTTTDERKARALTFSWRSNKNGEKKKKKRSYSPDPREKPFTATNLRYQEILGSYEIHFGTSRTEQLWDADGEISPGTSRQNSLDLRRQ